MLCQDQEDEAREGRDLAGREAPDQEAGDLAAPGAIMEGRDFTGLPRRPRRAGPTGITDRGGCGCFPFVIAVLGVVGDGSCCHPVIRGKRSPFSIPQQKEAARWGRLFLCYDSSTANWLL